jgi:hypothetical protein
MTDLTIPRFLDLRIVDPRLEDERRHLDRRIVEAIRYDFEIGLMTMAQVVRKYHGVVAASTARDIMNRTTYPEVKAVYHPLGYCKRFWRNK